MMGNAMCVRLDGMGLQGMWGHQEAKDGRKFVVDVKGSSGEEGNQLTITS
jgi:hypothetical protein